LVSFRPSLLVETQLLKQVNKSLIFAIKKKDDKIKEITAQLSAAQADQAAAAAQTQAAAQAAAQQLERVGLRSETEHSACESVLGQDDLDEVYAEEQEERLTATEAYAQSLRFIGSSLNQNKMLMLSLKNSMCDLQRESRMRRLCSCTCKFHDLESELSTAYDDERAAE
jgi:ABC-type transporter Mla subunit MlaD